MRQCCFRERLELLLLHHLERIFIGIHIAFLAPLLKALRILQAVQVVMVVVVPRPGGGGEGGEGGAGHITAHM